MTSDPESSDIEKKPLAGMTLDELTGVVLDHHLPKFTAMQIAQWIYKKRVGSIEAMTNVSLRGREELARHYTVGCYPPAETVESVDGTRKYLFEVDEGKWIESVYIPDRDRATLCVSSQAGCRMNCSFCMTGRSGFHGNLSANAIINQILSIPESEKLTNVVFMGMGEPLDNIDALLDVLEILTAPWGLEWSPKRITVSTVGKLDNLKLLLDRTKVHVALSVHLPLSKEREQFMPVEKAFPVKKVVDMLGRYDFTRQRRCSIEYIMWRGVNDDLQHARQLCELLKPIAGVRVNLIRYHSLPDDRELMPPDNSVMEQFRDYLNAHGIVATIRASRGEDIMAACGMLAGNKK